MSKPVMKRLDMSPKEAKESCDQTYTLFPSPKYALKRLRSIRCLEDVKFSLRNSQCHRPYERLQMNGRLTRQVFPVSSLIRPTED